MRFLKKKKGQKMNSISPQNTNIATTQIDQHRQNNEHPDINTLSNIVTISKLLGGSIVYSKYPEYMLRGLLVGGIFSGISHLASRAYKHVTNAKDEKEIPSKESLVLQLFLTTIFASIYGAENYLEAANPSKFALDPLNTECKNYSIFFLGCLAASGVHTAINNVLDYMGSPPKNSTREI